MGGPGSGRRKGGGGKGKGGSTKQEKYSKIRMLERGRKSSRISNRGLAKYVKAKG